MSNHSDNDKQPNSTPYIEEVSTQPTVSHPTQAQIQPTRQITNSAPTPPVVNKPQQVTSSPTTVVTDNSIPEWMAAPTPDPTPRPTELHTPNTEPRKVSSAQVTDPIPDTTTTAAERPVIDDLNFMSDTGSDDDTDSDRILKSIIGKELNSSVMDRTDDSSSAEDVRLVIPCQGSDEIGEALMRVGKEMGSENFTASFEDNDSYPRMLRDSLEHLSANTLMLTQCIQELKDSINTNSENNKNLTEILSSKVGSVGSTLTRGIPKMLTKNKHAVGSEASIFTASITQGLRRVPLWNSGIFLTLRALTLNELVSYYGSVNLGGYDYGRELGAWYFLYADYTVKKNVLEQLLPYALTSSNYSEWTNTKKLLSVISIHDYDVILWAFATMMYREGVPVSLVCTQPDCNHTEVIQADLAKTRYVDTTKISKEALAFMSEPDTIRTDSDLAKYHESLNLKDTFKYKVDNKATGETTYWEIDLGPASCDNYLVYGDIFNTGLFEKIHTPTTDDTREYLTVNYYKAFLPWITEVRCVNEEGYKAVGPASDVDVYMYIDATREDTRPAMMNILDMLQMENMEFAEVITKYIRKTKITHIAHPYFNCTKCNKQPSTSVDGFIPYDVQMHFFQLCLMRMLTTKD